MNQGTIQGEIESLKKDVADLTTALTIVDLSVNGLCDIVKPLTDAVQAMQGEIESLKKDLDSTVGAAAVLSERVAELREWRRRSNAE